MILPIYVNGADVLRQQSQDVTPENTPDLTSLVQNMFDTMHGADGIGLAAPQIGRPLNLFVIDLEEFITEPDDQLQNLNPELTQIVFINPKITEKSETTCPYTEGCLSVPGINENVNRPETITIEYLDSQFQPAKITLSGLWARVVQHEYEHLQGKLFTDNVSPIRKQMLRGKLEAMTRGKYRAAYKTKK